jgi:hypothetical protein
VTKKSWNRTLLCSSFERTSQPIFIDCCMAVFVPVYMCWLSWVELKMSWAENTPYPTAHVWQENANEISCRGCCHPVFSENMQCLNMQMSQPLSNSLQNQSMELYKDWSWRLDEWPGWLPAGKVLHYSPKVCRRHPWAICWTPLFLLITCIWHYTPLWIAYSLLVTTALYNVVFWQLLLYTVFFTSAFWYKTSCIIFQHIMDTRSHQYIHIHLPYWIILGGTSWAQST